MGDFEEEELAVTTQELKMKHITTTPSERQLNKKGFQRNQNNKARILLRMPSTPQRER